MKNAFKVFLLSIICMSSLISCRSSSANASSSTASESNVAFTYSDTTFTNEYGDKTNTESHPYSSIKVNPTENTLRSDFAMGVDGSMIQTIENLGGVYYNQEGQEQDVFQILRNSGVNFFRVRLWNNPKNKYGTSYGGGANDVTTDIALCKRAKAVGMNVLVDFHYSDFWADPDDQQLPKSWTTLNKDEIPAALKEFTLETLNEFKDAGVTVDAVQIGNEINNGMCGSYGAIDWNDTSTSFDYIASLIKSGIEGAKEVFPNTYTMIHLANGGNKAEFETFFTAMDERNVDYDIIGASYYPYLSGTLDELLANLNNVSALTGKPVMIAEVSWGYTDDSVEGVTANQYNGESYEDVGGYLTSEQAQATCIRDVVNVLSKVNNNMGLGLFYWEPAWLPIKGASWATALGQYYKYTGEDSHKTDYTDGLATWCNQGLFSYSGKALASLNVFKYLSSGEGYNASTETSTKVRSTSEDITLNLAADETLPTTYSVETDYDAIRQETIVWSDDSINACKTKGSHVASGVVNGKYSVSANVTCIENYVVDPGFENQGDTDVVKTPWNLRDVTPTGDKVAKLDRKTDTRSGTTDFNWYHSSKDFTFNIYQTISLPKGTYHLTTYIMAVAPSSKAHTKLNVYMKVGDTTYTADMKDIISGWNDGYHSTDEAVDSSNNPLLGNITVDADNTTVEIGIEGAAVKGAWGHNDDWSLVSVD